MKTIIVLFLSMLLIGCNSPVKEHYIINENDTIASLIERKDSLIKINIYQYDFKDWNLNRKIRDYFDVKPYECLSLMDSSKIEKYNERYSKNPNGYKLYLTGTLDTIAYLAFDNYDIGTYVKTPLKFDDKFQQRIMDALNIRSCDFYIMNGTGINSMEIYSTVDLDCLKTHDEKIDSIEIPIEEDETFEEDIIIPLIPNIGLKNLSCTLDYLYFILTNILNQDYTEEEHALYHSIAIRDIGEFAIKCMISSDENVRKRANRIILYLEKYQETDIKSIRNKLVYYYLQNSKKYNLDNVELVESRLNSKGDMVYSLYLYSKRFVSEDYGRYVVNNRDNIIGYAGFNYLVLVGPNDNYYRFPIYCGKELKADKIGWPNDYVHDKGKSIGDILEDIERFYNPF